MRIAVERCTRRPGGAADLYRATGQRAGAGGGGRREGESRRKEDADEGWCVASAGESAEGDEDVSRSSVGRRLRKI